MCKYFSLTQFFTYWIELKYELFNYNLTLLLAHYWNVNYTSQLASLKQTVILAVTIITECITITKHHRPVFP